MARDIDNVRYDEEYIQNPRGLKLCTCKWIPMNQQPKALIFICHGYAMECSLTMHNTAMRLAKVGFAVHGMDYEGHGKSAGLQGFVNSMEDIITDCADYFSSVCESKESRGMTRYLLGESMGGAVALNITRMKPDYWDGAVLVAPMCKIAEDMKPSPIMQNILIKLCQIIPTWKIMPTKDIVDVAFKVASVRQEIRANPYCYKGRPHLKTGYELLGCSIELEKHLHEITVPFIILHGEDDRVTDKAASKQLFGVAASTDKSLKLYPEMWHGLLYGEPLENIEIVFRDIIDWLDERTSIGSSRLEREQKLRNEDLSKANKQEREIS